LRRIAGLHWLSTPCSSGAIDATAAEKARARPATLKLSSRTARAGGWYADWIAKHELPKIAGSVQRVMRVRTTLQPELQQLAERVVNEALMRTGEARGASQAALVAMRPDGSVVAMVGGRDYSESQFNRAVDAQRQPGSAFKLFVYYAALQTGYSPDDTIDASPVEVGRWRPENYGGQEYGYMTLSQAFAHSVNSAAIRLGMTVGLDKVLAAARELGLDAPLAKVPSMALGTNEVSLLDLTGAFASVRAGHPKLEPWGIAAFGPEGTGLRSLGAPKPSIPELAHHREMTRLLQDVVDHGTGRAAALDDDSVAGKTGTSQDYRDAWFCGFQQGLGGRSVGRQRRPQPYEGCHGRIVARSDLEALRQRRNAAGRSFEGLCRRRGHKFLVADDSNAALLEHALDGVPDATQPGSSIGGDLFEDLHVRERRWPGHPIGDEPVLLLIVAHGLLSGRAKLPVGADG
jgi:penicillin-binding protein 1A